MSPNEEIFHLIRNSDPESLRSLIVANPGVKAARDQRGSTPLVLATYLGNLPATRILVEAGMDVNAVDAMGNTPLMGVCFKGYVEIAGYLIEQGADVNTRAGNGATPLHFAAMFNQSAMVDLLLAKGADAGAKDVKGLTAAAAARNQGFGELADRMA